MKKAFYLTKNNETLKTKIKLDIERRKMELKNIAEYNPEYHKDGSLVWKKIGEPTGKKGKLRKKVSSEKRNSILVLRLKKLILVSMILIQSY